MWSAKGRLLSLGLNELNVQRVHGIAGHVKSAILNNTESIIIMRYHNFPISNT